MAWTGCTVESNPRLTFLGAFLSFLARAFLGLPSLLSLAGFSLAAALGALAFLGAGLASEDAGRFFGLGAASCSGCRVQIHAKNLSSWTRWQQSEVVCLALVSTVRSHHIEPDPAQRGKLQSRHPGSRRLPAHNQVVAAPLLPTLQQPCQQSAERLCCPHSTAAIGAAILTSTKWRLQWVRAAPRHPTPRCHLHRRRLPRPTRRRQPRNPRPPTRPRRPPPCAQGLHTEASVLRTSGDTGQWSVLHKPTAIAVRTPERQRPTAALRPRPLQPLLTGLLFKSVTPVSTSSPRSRSRVRWPPPGPRSASARLATGSPLTLMNWNRLVHSPFWMPRNRYSCAGMYQKSQNLPPDAREL